MITFKSKGDWKKTFDFLRRDRNSEIEFRLKQAGEEGVAALSSVTPILTGRLASSWFYDIKRSKDGILITWRNSDIEDGENVALLVQNGHRTKGGYYIKGRDFITPTIQPIMDRIADNVWKEVTNE